MSRPKNKHRRFVLLERQTLISAQWKSLSPAEMIVYVYVKNNFNGVNNGSIPLKYSELKGVFAPATISKALKGLQVMGWIEKTKHGGMYRFSCQYLLTGKFDSIK